MGGLSWVDRPGVSSAGQSAASPFEGKIRLGLADKLLLLLPSARSLSTTST